MSARAYSSARAGVWRFETLAEANAYYWDAEGQGRGISMHLFCIRDKLKELNNNPRPIRLFEAHPEMIFWRIAGRVLENKNTEKGRQERIKILEEKGVEKIRR